MDRRVCVSPGKSLTSRMCLNEFVAVVVVVSLFTKRELLRGEGPQLSFVWCGVCMCVRVIVRASRLVTLFRCGWGASNCTRSAV